ncbi:DinB family protein [Krasilnikoviella flava]|uniref:Pentapeptide repeat-containing protein n=1 Tax=Krasilnikoviella flava TaxID=526729 RepID=A0A1T5JL95_9MICO|nr:DinB family protein [Krasilnikoviella flava]SKC52144.1 Pentapeptide repeat-containing protein [Krasilnikoviella flava]
MTLFGPDDELRGARLVEADMTGATFRLTKLDGVRFDQSFMPGAVMRGVDLTDADIDGQITGLRVNGVDVAPLVEAELDRRYPGREQARSADLAEQRASLDAALAAWDAHLARAAALGPGAVDDQVDGEWSTAQTLRHLVFAMDGWVRYGLRGIDDAFWYAGLPFTEYEPEVAALGVDLTATPPLAETLEAHADRIAQVYAVYDSLAGTDVTVDAPRLPPWAPEGFTRAVHQSIGVVAREHWAHLQFAERDLTTLEGRAGRLVGGAG